MILLNTKDEEDYKKKYGIIDFGDLCLSSYVFDLATSLAFFMISASVEDFVGHTASFMAGYVSKRKLSILELDVLYTSICASYCKELLLCEYEYVIQKDENEYLLTSSTTGWKQLAQLRSMGNEKFMDKLTSVAD